MSRCAARATGSPAGSRDHAEDGKTKYGYLEKPESEQRAGDYLRGATKPGEIAGRQLALLAMATYADQNAVAVSSRSWHHIKASGPWAVEADELLDKLVVDNLPDAALALLAPVLENRKTEQEERSAARSPRGVPREAGGHRGADRRPDRRGARPGRAGSRRGLGALDTRPHQAP